MRIHPTGPQSVLVRRVMLPGLNQQHNEISRLVSWMCDHQPAPSDSSHCSRDSIRPGKEQLGFLAQKYDVHYQLFYHEKKSISSPFHIPAELHFQGYKEHASKEFEYFWYLWLMVYPFDILDVFESWFHFFILRMRLVILKAFRGPSVVHTVSATQEPW